MRSRQRLETLDGDESKRFYLQVPVQGVEPGPGLAKPWPRTAGAGLACRRFRLPCRHALGLLEALHRPEAVPHAVYGHLPLEA